MRPRPPSFGYDATGAPVVVPTYRPRRHRLAATMVLLVLALAAAVLVGSWLLPAACPTAPADRPPAGAVLTWDATQRVWVVHAAGDGQVRDWDLDQIDDGDQAPNCRPL